MYDGTVEGRMEIPLSSTKAASPFLYNIAVLTFILDFLLGLELPNVRLSDMTV